MDVKRSLAHISATNAPGRRNFLKVSPSATILAAAALLFVGGAWSLFAARHEDHGKAVRLRSKVFGREGAERRGGAVQSIAISPDGTYLVVTDFYAPLEVWDRQTGRKLRTLRPGGSDNNVAATAFSPDGRTLASADEKKTVTLWDMSSGTLKQTLRGHTARVNTVAFSPDGKTVSSGADDRTVRLWDAQTGQPTRTLAPALPHRVYRVAFSPNGSIVSAADRQGNVQQWSVPTGDLRQSIPAPPFNDVSEWGMFYPVAFSHDGTRMARGDGDERIRLIDLRTGALLRALPGHHEIAHETVFSPDDRLLATAGQSGKHEPFTGGNQHDLRLWDGQSGALLAKSGDWNRFTTLAFDPDGSTIISGDSGDLLLWDVRPLRRGGAPPAKP